MTEAAPEFIVKQSILSSTRCNCNLMDVVVKQADSVLDPTQEEDLVRASSWVIELNYRGAWDPVKTHHWNSRLKNYHSADQEIYLSYPQI